MLVQPVAIAAPTGGPAPPLPGTLLITDDGRGVGAELVRQLCCRGQRVALVEATAVDETSHNGARFAVDLNDAAAVEDLFMRVQLQLGEVSGIIHLLPLAAPASNGNWHSRMRREVKSLFLLARSLAKQMRRSGAAGKLLLAATAMGGTFGSGPAALPESFFPGRRGKGLSPAAARPRDPRQPRPPFRYAGRSTLLSGRRPRRAGPGRGHLSQGGLQLIPPGVGPLRFDEELRYGRKGECEVVIAGEVGQLRRSPRSEARR